MTSEENKAFIRRYLEAISGHDKPRALIDTFISDSDSALKQDIAAAEAGFPRYQMIVEDMIAEGDKVVVRFTVWESRHVNPEGEIIEVLGPASAPGVDMLSIIRKHNLPVEFPSAVQREAERIEERIHDSELERREDLRGQLIVTIDPSIANCASISFIGSWRALTRSAHICKASTSRRR